MIEKLSKEQEDLMVIIRDKWVNQLYSLPKINKDQFQKGINWLYALCNYNNPAVYYCKSPLEAQLLCHILRNNVCSNVWRNVGDNVLRNVGSKVRDNVSRNVGDNVWSKVRDNVESNVWSNVESNVRSNVWSNVESNVGDNVDNVGDKQNYTFQQFCRYGHLENFGWVSFYDFFTQIGVLSDDNFNCFSELLQSGYYTMIQMEKVVICVENPEYIKMQNNRLHCTTDYAIKWQDGTGMNFINGQYLEEDLFFKILEDRFTFEDFIKITNEEVKSTCISFLQEKYGDNYLVDFFKDSVKEVDTFVDKKKQEYLKNTKGMNVGVYTLFKGNINNFEIAYIRCYCPSTDRMFFLGVESSNTNAKDAIASLCRVPVKLAKEIKSINRQGERFSFVWTEKGKEIKQSMTKNDWQNTISLKGDMYFEKMQFEY